MISAGQNTPFSINKTLNAGGRLLDLSTPVVMGILNVTPDSFYDGGKSQGDLHLLRQVEQMVHEGAAIFDVGGYSSRPGAIDISAEEERSRVLPAIRAIQKRFPDCLLSVDTFREEVARPAVEEGACMINDISGGEADQKMFDLVAELNIPYICMHMKGTPQTMKSLTAYDNLVKDVITYLQKKIVRLHTLGVKDIIIDPGFGFAKTIEQNFQLLKSLDHFRILQKPMLAGLSRKSMIWKTLDTTPEHALNGSTVLNTIALLKGASILRVHDVKEASEIIKLFHALNLP